MHINYIPYYSFIHSTHSPRQRHHSCYSIPSTHNHHWTQTRVWILQTCQIHDTSLPKHLVPFALYLTMFVSHSLYVQRGKRTTFHTLSCIIIMSTQYLVCRFRPSCYWVIYPRVYIPNALPSFQSCVYKTIAPFHSCLARHCIRILSNT